jgi:hypothetical protein
MTYLDDLNPASLTRLNPKSHTFNRPEAVSSRFAGWARSASGVSLRTFVRATVFVLLYGLGTQRLRCQSLYFCTGNSLCTFVGARHAAPQVSVFVLLYGQRKQTECTLRSLWMMGGLQLCRKLTARASSIESCSTRSIGALHGRPCRDCRGCSVSICTVCTSKASKVRAPAGGSGGGCCVSFCTFELVKPVT